MREDDARDSLLGAGRSLQRGRRFLLSCPPSGFFNAERFTRPQEKSLIVIPDIPFGFPPKIMSTAHSPIMACCSPCGASDIQDARTVAWCREKNDFGIL